MTSILCQKVVSIITAVELNQQRYQCNGQFTHTAIIIVIIIKTVLVYN